MGTEIQKLDLEANKYPDNMDGFNDGLTISAPRIIEEIHRSYLRAGADCIETNTFGSNRLKLEEYGYSDRVVEVNELAASIAVSVTREFSDKQRFVIGSMGPSGYLPSSNDPDLGRIELGKIVQAFSLQAEGLILGEVDALLIETSQDILEVKLAIEGCFQAILKTGKSIPIISNVTLDKYGKMLLGTNVQAAYTTVCDMGILAFGLNCSTGPQEMDPSIRWLDEQDELPVLVMPNAGIPENEGGKAVYKMSPSSMASTLKDFLHKYKNIRMIGGCCGTTPEHILEFSKMIRQ
ncbi:MAG: homocysteine S-methyltransferase family protein [Thermoproteota archaeon]|nr:homocysteine S-methyltransferase family protein [Thermoproteota archaeon]